MANSVALELPTNEGIRQFSLSLLKNAQSKAESLEIVSNEENKEVLHDFRVSVRRLCSFLGVYQDHLTKNKWRESFIKLIRTSNQSRDLEVQQAWLSEQIQVKELPLSVRQGAKIMLKYIEDIPSEATLKKSKLSKDFRVTSKDFRRYLKKARLKTKKPDFAKTTAKLLQAQARKLQPKLSEISNGHDKAKMHKARLKTKVLRYTVELLQKEVSFAKELAKELKYLQDVLGNIHDLHTLELQITKRIKSLSNTWREGLTVISSNEHLAELKRGLQGLEQCQFLAALLNHVYEERNMLFKSFENWRGKAEKDFWPKLAELTKGLKDKTYKTVETQ